MIASALRSFARCAASLAITIAFSATVMAGQASFESAAQVRGAEAALARAMHTRTASDLQRLLSPGYVLRGTPDIDRATWLRNALALCWGDRADIDDFSATPLNDVVVASLTLTFYVDPSTCRPAVLRSLVTDVWSRSADGWQLQVRHSAPPPVGSGVVAQFGAVPERPPIGTFGRRSWPMAGTHGNTTTSTVGSGATAIHTAATSTSQLEFRVLRNRTDGVTRAQVLTGRGRHARNVGGLLQVFADLGIRA